LKTLEAVPLISANGPSTFQPSQQLERLILESNKLHHSTINHLMTPRKNSSSKN